MCLNLDWLTLRFWALIIGCESSRIASGKHLALLRYFPTWFAQISQLRRLVLYAERKTILQLTGEFLRRLHVRRPRCQRKQIHTIKHSVVFVVIQFPFLGLVNIMEKISENIVMLVGWSMHNSCMHVYWEGTIKSTMDVAIDY
jgi:hypothetical protein